MRIQIKVFLFQRKAFNIAELGENIRKPGRMVNVSVN